jgi:hypothetical protein
MDSNQRQGNAKQCFTLGARPPNLLSKDNLLQTAQGWNQIGREIEAESQMRLDFPTLCVRVLFVGRC